MENNDDMTQMTEVAEESTEVVTAEEVQVNDEPATGLSSEEIERMVAEAEERGYLRGRNERVDELMRRPASQGEASAPDDPEEDEDAVMILKKMRRSVWD